MIDVAIFASGTGSNFYNLATNPELKNLINIRCLVCDNPKASVIEKAKLLNIETLIVNPKNFDSKIDYEKYILENIEDVKYIFLAGYMRIISPYFLGKFKGKIVNIHPSLLPLYKGKDSIKRAFEDKVEFIGISIHYVNEEVDGGQILAQDKFRVDYKLSLDEVTQKVHELEHRLYPKNIIKILTDN